MRLNVGFIVAQSTGYSRDFTVEIPQVRLPPDLELTNLAGDVRVSRTPQGLLVQAKIQGDTTLDCVRCLEPFSTILHANFTELYAFSRRNITESGLLVPDDGQIDLAPLLREIMFLELPISPLCCPECKGLCPVCGENLNFTTCNHEDEPADPRLDVLKKLLENDNRAP
ncbi:MAG: hypothetical protein A2Z49_10145 [Chloroflexi bacterium RBG_19FT_COMBO_56_12]|nr:MAG: hypothetical protein A2Z49_10145 [Chloroflexi bacterium RBG_19FT_COMBO_56_12]